MVDVYLDFWNSTIRACIITRAARSDIVYLHYYVLHYTARYRDAVTVDHLGFRSTPLPSSICCPEPSEAPSVVIVKSG